MFHYIQDKRLTLQNAHICPEDIFYLFTFIRYIFRQAFLFSDHKFSFTREYSCYAGQIAARILHTEHVFI